MVRLAIAVIAVSLTGCDLMLVASMTAGLPDPVSTIDVLSDDDNGRCAALKTGRDLREDFAQAVGRHYAADPTVSGEAAWKRQEGRAAFQVLVGTEEPKRGHGIPIDAARAYFDVTGDGAADLIYEVHVPPYSRSAFVLLPAREPVRAWFEGQLGQLRTDWRTAVDAHGGHIIESVADMGDFALVRAGGVAYFLRYEQSVPFDAARRSPPLTLGDPELDASADKSAAIAGAYRVDPDHSLRRTCTFLFQDIAIMVAGL